MLTCFNNILDDASYFGDFRIMIYVFDTFYMCVGAILAVGFAFIGIPPWIAYFLVQGHIIYRLKTK